MTAIFMVCAIVGSVIVLVQFVMTLTGMGHDFDGEVHDLGGDVHVDTDHVDHGEGSHFFSVLSFRTVTAALAIFGLTGLSAKTAGVSDATTILMALAAGAVALFAVAWVMRFMMGLRDDGTVHIERAVGHQGTVYLTVPAGHAGAGKVFLNLQSRTVECQAVTTSKESIPTGVPVVVVGIVGPNTVEVECVREETPIHA
ncbi:MAG: hypothetical protein RBU21_06955 [FCB group bacterium]|jgi:hypothetical protein|nr:hypothetical protein [FCB group bacterium]